MATNGARRPIIIIKRPVMAARHHGGAWKIAFADFMTAMFAFFLVMWLLSSSSPNQLTGIAAHFKRPLTEAISGGPAINNSPSVIPGGGDPAAIKEEVKMPESDDEAQDVNRLDQMKAQLDKMIEASPLLKEFRPQLLIDITPEGLRIQIVDSSNRPMFDRSSAQVAPYMRTILREIAPVINAQSNKITLSGHTDATTYAQGDKSYSNWELSADRANASRRELVAGGLQEIKVLRVMGVASSMHLNQSDPLAPVNRRISIVVLNHRAQMLIEKANSATGASVSIKPGAAGQAAVSLSTARPDQRS
ncbi:flagellar motor protein MotB [Polaromonas sp. CG_23.6]|uniref:flagellar motor protein MotB n=1 Tax=Polaromonas sp. CG_23.6 TaxID=2760709 RepID=UPI002475B4CF|nr:flagellar motor protein MotB [Polaromonas sp. CG_23.6]MDH6184151.1 chemotaxis protein MotB [Polaromonas sp. CG_23.6]